MTLFKSCIDDRSCKEYENILSTDNLFMDKTNINQQERIIFGISILDKY